MIYQVGFYTLRFAQFNPGPAQPRRRQGAAVPGWLDDNGLVADFFRELFRRLILSPFVKQDGCVFLKSKGCSSRCCSRQ
jgi:hypothetical protein